MQLHIKKNKITQWKYQLIFYLLPVSTSGEVWFLGTTQPTHVGLSKMVQFTSSIDLVPLSPAAL